MSRRRFVGAAGGLAAATILSGRAGPRPVHAASGLIAADLVDEGAAFARGQMAGVRLAGRGAVAALELTGETGLYTSAPLMSPMPFTHVGLHWAGLMPTSSICAFELRTSVDGTAWSAWRPVRVDCLPGETPTGEYFGPPLSALGHQVVQYRIRLRAGGGGPRLDRVTATVIASQPVPLGNQLRTVPVADPDSGRTIQVTPRELWLAEERLRTRENGSEIWPEMFVPVKKLIVHHTATRNDYATIDEAAAEVRAIYYFHAVTREWGDIGYNALVDRFGNLYEGRFGRGEGVSREMLSAGVVAGHDFFHNYGSAGVALLGDATQDDWPMPAPSGPIWDALVRYSVFESGRSFLPPLAPDRGGAAKGRSPAVSDFLRSDDAWSDAMRNLSGHRETNDTECPGDVVMAQLDDLRLAIDRGLADTSRTGVTVTAAGREAAVGATLHFRCTAEPPEEGWRLAGYEYCMEGWVRLPESEDIAYLSGYTAGNQPMPDWTRLETQAPAVDLRFTPVEAGHYTLHVRTIVERGSGKTAARRVSAYAGRHTYLVRGAADPRRDP